MSAANLDSIFAALADPTRRAIVARLATGEATVLERAGLISRGRDAQRRPCQLRAAALDEITRWTQHTREAWDERFAQLDEYLKTLQAKPSQEKNNDGRKKS